MAMAVIAIVWIAQCRRSIACQTQEGAACFKCLGKDSIIHARFTLIIIKNILHFLPLYLVSRVIVLQEFLTKSITMAVGIMRQESLLILETWQLLG